MQTPFRSRADSALHAIHCANIRGAMTRRQAFARYHAYMRATSDDAFRFALGCELTCTLHRIDAQAERRAAIDTAPSAQ